MNYANLDFLSCTQHPSKAAQYKYTLPQMQPCSTKQKKMEILLHILEL